MTRHVSTHLETELEQTEPTRAQWDSWVRAEPVLTGLTYRDLRQELRTGNQDRKDQLLGALVRIATTDSTAFNVVMACLLPGIRHRIARLAPFLDRDDAVAVMVDALHEAVRRHDTDEPPRFVAAGLLALPTRRLRHAVAAHQAWSSSTRRTAGDTTVASAPELPASTLLGTAVDAGVLGELDAWLIHETRITDRPLRDAANKLGLGYEAAKKRRQRAESTWVAWWAPERWDQGSRR